MIYYSRKGKRSIFFWASLVFSFWWLSSLILALLPAPLSLQSDSESELAAPPPSPAFIHTQTNHTLERDCMSQSVQRADMERFFICPRPHRQKGSSLIYSSVLRVACVMFSSVCFRVSVASNLASSLIPQKTSLPCGTDVDLKCMLPVESCSEKKETTKKQSRLTKHLFGVALLSYYVK